MAKMTNKSLVLYVRVKPSFDNQFLKNLLSLNGQFLISSIAILNNCGLCTLRRRRRGGLFEKCMDKELFMAS
jgi:hypothetical protein